jgi:hypothetical protein
MAKTLDYWDQKGDKIPLTLVEDPDNPGQYLYPPPAVLSVQTPVRRIVHKAEPIATNAEFYGEVITANPYSTTLRVIVQSSNSSKADDGLAVYFGSQAEFDLDEQLQYLPIVPVVSGKDTATAWSQVGQAEICMPLYAECYQIYYAAGPNYAGYLKIISMEY